MSTRERRSLWGSISTSKKVNLLSMKAALLYTWAIAHFDDYGLQEGDARILKATIVPLRDDIPLNEIPDLIHEIASTKANETDPPLWVVYHTEKDTFICDPVNSERQTFHGFHKKPSKIAAFLKTHQYSVPDWCNVGADWVPDWCLSEGEVKGSEGEVKDKRSVATERGFKLSERLLKSIRTWNPDFKPTFDKNDLNRWGLDFDLAMRVDKRSPTYIELVIDWLPKDEFWRKNILSGLKLREKYDRLVVEMKFPKKGSPKKQDGIEKGSQRLKDAFSGKQKGIEHKPG